MALMRSTILWAETPGPVRFFGHDVTMRQRTVWAWLTVGAARQAAPTPSAARRESLGPKGMKMMHGAVPVSNVQLSGSTDRGADEVLASRDSIRQWEAFCEPRCDGRRQGAAGAMRV